MITDSLPPQSLETERAIIACCLQAPGLVGEILEVIRGPGEFYAEKNRLLFEVIFDLHGRRRPCDRASVAARLEELHATERAGGEEYLAGLATLQVERGNWPRYVEILADKARRRRSQQRLREIANQMGDPDADLETAAIEAAWAVEDTDREYEDVRHISDVAAERLERLRARQRGEIAGMTYGYRSLDVATGGMEPGKLILIAARPSQGKTGLALDIARRSARKTGLPWLFVARDDAAEVLADRALISGAAVPGSVYRLGQLNNDHWRRLELELMTLRDTPVHVTDRCRTVADIRKRVRWMQKAHKQVGAVVIDYMQLMAAENPRGGRHEQVQAISQDIKGMAVDLQVPVLALSQLSRAVERRDPPRPVLSDLYESGQIEADAEVVMFLYREEYYLQRKGDQVPVDKRGRVEIILAKQKNMPVGVVPMHFHPEWVRFDEIERRQDESINHPQW